MYSIALSWIGCVCVWFPFQRIPWSHMRKQYFSSGVNKRSLETIDRAAFFVTLDDEEQGMRGDDPAGNLDRYAKSLLHGKCYDRWVGGGVCSHNRHTYAAENKPATNIKRVKLWWLWLYLSSLTVGHKKKLSKKTIKSKVGPNSFHPEMEKMSRRRLNLYNNRTKHLATVGFKGPVHNIWLDFWFLYR